MDAALGTEDQITPVATAPKEAKDHAPGRDGKRDPQGEFPENRHPARSSGAAS